MLVKGRVELTRSLSSVQEYYRLGIMFPGDTFGLGELLLDRYYTSATALENCVLLAIDNKTFVSQCMALPEVRDAVLRDYNSMIRILILRVVEGSGSEQLALYLYQLSMRCGQKKNDTILITEKQYQPKISEILNMSREHVTRLFTNLKREGVVDFNKGYPVISKEWLETTIKDKEYAASIHFRS